MWLETGKIVRNSRNFTFFRAKPMLLVCKNSHFALQDGPYRNATEAILQTNKGHFGRQKVAHFYHNQSNRLSSRRLSLHAKFCDISDFGKTFSEYRTYESMFVNIITTFITPAESVLRKHAVINILKLFTSARDV